jgi:23S rRNA (guanine745-N1)-methyltransferase
MVQGRRAFLDAGYYAPLAKAVADTLKVHLPPMPAEILDVGCGEGYYTDHLRRSLEDNGQAPHWTGIDISKEAIRAACGRSPTTEWVVASAARIPLPDNCLDGMTALFTLLEPVEYYRVLKAEAPLVIATTGPDHLRSLREEIYDEVTTQPFDPAAKLSGHFAPMAVERVRFELNLEGESIQQLLGMTPHFWRTSPERQKALKSLHTLRTEVDVNVSVFQKSATAP